MKQRLCRVAQLGDDLADKEGVHLRADSVLVDVVGAIADARAHCSLLGKRLHRRTTHPILNTGTERKAADFRLLTSVCTKPVAIDAGMPNFSIGSVSWRINSTGSSSNSSTSDSE